MPTITVEKTTLYTLAGLSPALTLTELEERLPLVKGELNVRDHDGRKVSTAAADLRADQTGLDLRIELNDTNRPDLWSVEGIARQLRDHERGSGNNYPFFTAADTAYQIEVDPQLTPWRPYIGGFLATGQSVTEESLLAFIEAQETLTRNFGQQRQSVSIGLYRGDTLAFPIRYQAVGRSALRFEPLAPAGEAGAQWPTGVALTPAEILEQHPTGREYGAIVADWDQVPILLDATGQVLSFPPIINSADLGRVQPGTPALFVEATGTDLDQVLLTLNILATNLADRGWTIQPVTTHYPYPTARGTKVTAPHPLARTCTVPVAEFARLLGEELTLAEVQTRLAAYGIQAEVVAESIQATAPSYRQDYLHGVDVIEDYAISRGYEHFAIAMPSDFTVGKLHPLTEFEDLVRDLMIGFGFEEAFCNILTSLEQLHGRMDLTNSVGAPPFHGGTQGAVVQIANVMNRNYACLRDWIVPSLLEIAAHSLGALYPHRIFEVGEVAVYDPTQSLGSRTESRVAAVIASDEASFDSAQSVVYALLGNLHQSFQVRPWSHPSFIEGRVGLIINNQGTPLGFLGELSPQVLTAWGVRTPIAAFEIVLDPMVLDRGGPHHS
ncbi:MAG: phenylalanine--tRNA ligase subunit beta [Caldilineaceae bacterium]|nr:phenylalanine--tRNA ligase subunit beta [Caldilineaceae bacterium]